MAIACSMNWKPSHPAFKALLHAFMQQTTPVYVVGGVVRDFLLGIEGKRSDLDLTIDQAALPTAQRVADRLGWAFYPLDTARDVARLVFSATNGEPLICDIASLRGGTLETDLLARDFTINAMAFALERNGETRLIDICKGQADLTNRIVRRVSAASLAEDAVRLLRAVRFAHQLNFTLDEETTIQIKRLQGTLRLASAERVRDELWKMLATDKPAQAIDDLQKLGLLGYVLPEISALVGVEQSYPHYQDTYHHTLQVVQNSVQIRNWIKGQQVTEKGPAQTAWQQALEPLRARLRYHFAHPLAVGHARADWLVWHALLHDVGKPAVRTAESQPSGSVRYRFLEHEATGAALTTQRLTQLRFNRQEVALAEAVVQGHMRPHLLHNAFAGQTISRRARYRFFRDVGGKQFEHPAGVETVLLALADYLAIHKETPPDWSAYLRHMVELLSFAFDEDGLQEVHRQPLLDGHTLMTQLHLAPGRQVGQLLAAVLEAQAAGEIQNREQAIALAAQLAAEKIA